MVLHRRQAKLLHRNVRIVGAHEMHKVLVHAQSGAYVQVRICTRRTFVHTLQHVLKLWTHECARRNTLPVRNGKSSA
jgi:hypothetical protein